MSTADRDLAAALRALLAALPPMGTDRDDRARAFIAEHAKRMSGE